MLEHGTHTRPVDRRLLVGVATIAAFAIVVIAIFWTPFERHVARNDPRVGTTTENSQKDPGATLTGPASGNGG